ncbi:MAG TPA: glycosyl hydrolase 108 family protein, partial [Candidatus Obscuribacterales bacterium]
MSEFNWKVITGGCLAILISNAILPPELKATVTQNVTKTVNNLGGKSNFKAPEETAKLVTEAGINDTNFAWAIHHILVPEGGFSNHHNDGGGATKYGIIESVAKRHGLDVRRISKVDAIKIYYQDYWLESGANKAPSPLNLAIMNSYVNSGKKWEIKGNSPQEQAENYLSQQDNYYTQIYTNRPSQTVFKTG